MTDNIRVASCVLLRDGRAKLSEDAEFQGGGVYITTYKNPTSKKHRRNTEFIRGDSHLNWQYAF